MTKTILTILAAIALWSPAGFGGQLYDPSEVRFELFDGKGFDNGIKVYVNDRQVAYLRINLYIPAKSRYRLVLAIEDKNDVLRRAIKAGKFVEIDVAMLRWDNVLPNISGNLFDVKLRRFMRAIRISGNKKAPNALSVEDRVRALELQVQKLTERLEQIEQ